MRNPPKPISKIASHLNFQAKHETPQEFELPYQAITIVNDLFKDLKGVCTAWQQTFTDIDIEQAAKKQWAQALFENGVVNQHQVDIGMKKVRKRAKPWLPSTGEFIAWCKPSLEDYGLPAVERALQMVVNGQKKQHPAIYVAAKATGLSNLKNLSHKVLLPMFRRNYEIACNRVMNGEDLSAEIPLALPEKVCVPVKATSQFFAMKQKLKQVNGAA